MQKIVVNNRYGGFSLSDVGLERYRELSGRKTFDFFFDDLERDDPHLVEVVNELGVDANDWCSELKIIEIPDDVEWEICEYDGREWVAEKHRKWY